MSDRPDGVERGARATSTSRPPSRPEPGPGRPVHSNGPERTPLTGPGSRARRPDPGPEGSALRVVLVSRDKMLAGALRSLIDTPGGVRMLDWYSNELDSAIWHADVVIVDMPPTLHQRIFDVIDGRFLGRAVVLLEEGERAEAVPGGPSRAVLYRPLQIGELWSAVTGSVWVEVAASGVEPGDGEAENRAGEPEVEARPEPDPSREPVLQPDPEPSPDPVFRPEPDNGPELEVEPEPEAADDQPPVDAAAGAGVEAQGLPVAESGRLIGLSGLELDPVIGPGQVAPGMDEATFERLRWWKTGSGARPLAGARKGPAPGRRRSEPESRAARRAREADAKARRERARQDRAEGAPQVKAARVEARLAARAEARQAKAARAEARGVARDEARQAKAAEAEARRAIREVAHETKAAAAQARRTAREEARQAQAAEAAARRAARDEAPRAEAARAREAQKAASREARSAKAEEKKAARTEARQEKTARVEERRATRAAKVGERRATRAAKVEERRATRGAKAE